MRGVDNAHIWGQQLLTPKKKHRRICHLRSIDPSFCQGPRPYQLWWLSPWGLLGIHRVNDVNGYMFGKTSSGWSKCWSKLHYNIPYCTTSLQVISFAGHIWSAHFSRQHAVAASCQTGQLPSWQRGTEANKSGWWLKVLTIISKANQNPWNPWKSIPCIPHSRPPGSRPASWCFCGRNIVSTRHLKTSIAKWEETLPPNEKCFNIWDTERLHTIKACQHFPGHLISWSNLRPVSQMSGYICLKTSAYGGFSAWWYNKGAPMLPNTNTLSSNHWKTSCQDQVLRENIDPSGISPEWIGG